jgi:methyl-accepting chemotaxis protein
MNKPLAMSALPRQSLRFRLSALISALVAAIAIMVMVFFPWRMETFSRKWVERRATGVVRVLATAVGSGLDFDDASYVTEMLNGMSSSPEVLYAVVFRANGTVLAGYKPELVPAGVPVGVTDLALTYGKDQLRVDAPLKGRGGTTGTLRIGFSLGELESEVSAHRAVVAFASAILFAIGLVASSMIASVLVRPIEQMTNISSNIARGDLSQDELKVDYSGEIGQMAAAFNRMLRYLRALAASADQIAQGDLTVRVDMEGQVADAFNRMIDAQRVVVRQLADTAVQLAATASEIHAATQEQLATATQQSAGVEEVSGTMQSLLDSASHIADTARTVLSNAEKTKETTDGMSRRFGALTGHTNRIAELLEVIREIADRSDLLALNASLEATRAGEAGRPFSLVAGEMRRLAERVTASVQDVKALVADVREFGSNTIMANEQGRKLADDTTESARKITLVTQQQRTGTEQVSQSMRDIGSGLSQSVAAARDVRSSTEALKLQAERLGQIVGRFRIDNSSGLTGSSQGLPAGGKGGQPA